MTARDHYVANRAPDWRAAKPGHKAPARRLPKSVRKAPRDYRRKVIPMAEYHDPLTWPVMAAIVFAVACIVAMIAAGWIV